MRPPASRLVASFCEVSVRCEPAHGAREARGGIVSRGHAPLGPCALQCSACMRACKAAAHAARLPSRVCVRTAHLRRHLACVQRILAHRGVQVLAADLCEYGLKSTDGTESIKKPTTFMTNSPCVAGRLSRLCQGGHTHKRLMDGRKVTQLAGQYPPELCSGICCGIRDPIL